MAVAAKIDQTFDASFLTKAYSQNHLKSYTETNQQFS